jgi:outer membrane protein OmpA-like peptidoglycan-associated protein
MTVSTDLLESLNRLLTPDFLGRAATALGDPEPAVSKGFGAAFPVILGGLAHRASDDEFASTLFNLVRDPANDGGLLDDLGRLFAPGAATSPMATLGNRLLGALFGNNLGGLGNALANHAGVRPASGSSLLNLAAPLVLSVLGKAVRSGNLNLSSLVHLLTGNKNAYAAAVPGPLARLDSYLASPATRAHAAPPPEKKSSIWRWLLPLLIILAILWLLSRCMGPKEKPAEMAPAPMPAPQAEPAPAAPPVEAPATSAMPMASFYFDVDVFEVPVAREGSMAAVVDYLKANPTAVASISGYHDPSGDAAHNEELAKNRAMAVRDAMVAAGVPESQIELVKPVVTTGSGDPDEARRVDVTIRP